MRLNIRSALVFGHDVAAACVAWLAAYWLRFNLDIPSGYLHDALATAGWVVVLQAVFFWRFGLYRGMWRFASLPDLKRILMAISMAALATPAMLFLARIDAVVPRSVLFLDPLLLLLIMGGSRLAYRSWREQRLASLDVESRRVLVVGGGRAADALLRELQQGRGRWQVVGVLDDADESKGRHLQGVPVLGPYTELAEWVEKTGAEEVILALPSAPPAVRRQITEACAKVSVPLLTVPSLDDIMHGRVAVSTLRPIELDDLLGRAPVVLDDAGLGNFLGGRVVLVTGAGGSIGSELCRQIARFRPARLVFLENSELALYRLEQEFRRDHAGLAIVCAVGDVRDPARMREIMAEHLPAVVFHAAAYKHVPLMEEVNALQALKNNVLGTWVCAQAAEAAGVDKFVLISSDKAVNPTNIMGASKRLAEMVCQSAQGTPTRFVSVRFGNVLGSSGSVIPKFREQIEAGGPITVTHPEITRYFMSIPEAAQLVLQAGMMGQGGEIFVLDMGEPMKIADLARLMIRLAGKSEEEVELTYTGLRPGEKLYEELLADAESTLPTPHPKLRVARARHADPAEVTAILKWIAATAIASDADVRSQLRAWVSEYRPNGQ